MSIIYAFAHSRHCIKLKNKFMQLINTYILVYMSKRKLYYAYILYTYIIKKDQRTRAHHQSASCCSSSPCILLSLFFFQFCAICKNFKFANALLELSSCWISSGNSKS